jgi:hypothetical protein
VLAAVKDEIRHHGRAGHVIRIVLERQGGEQPQIENVDGT